MNKIFISIALFLFSIAKTKACDICGCGVGNFNPYMFPHLAKNFISFNYQYQHYHTNLIDNGTEMNNREYYSTFMLAAQYSPVRRLQLMVVLPFQSNRQTGEEGNKTLNKPGDFIFLANYKLLDHTSGKNKSMIRQTFLAGGGLKFATGSYHFDETNESHVGNSNFQAGTGSTDFLINLSYSLRYRKFGFSNGFTYKINTSNKSNYRFGNKVMNVTQVKYIKDLGRFSLIPSVGIMSERLQEDRQGGVKIEDHHTGGYNIQGLAGLDINNRNIAMGFTYTAPVKQNLADGHIKAQPGINVHISYSF